MTAITPDFPTDAATGVDASDLRVSRVRPLRGPNYWRLAPVIACDVRCGSLEEVTTAELPGFTDRLLAALPTLAEHPCSRGAAGGFVERLREGTRLPHVLVKPRKLRGLESQGMVVAASYGEEGRPVIATFTEDVPNGARLK